MVDMRNNREIPNQFGWKSSSVRRRPPMNIYHSIRRAAGRALTQVEYKRGQAEVFVIGIPLFASSRGP